MKKLLFALFILLASPVYAASPYSTTIDIDLTERGVAAKDIDEDYVGNNLVDAIVVKVREELIKTWDENKDFIWISNIDCKVKIDNEKNEIASCYVGGGVSPLENTSMHQHRLLIVKYAGYTCNYAKTNPLILQGIKESIKKS